jgi:hypothetical protein
MTIDQNSRSNAVLLWFVCSLFLIPLSVMQLLQALFGSPVRSHKMALAIDQCGNALFGGDPAMTISERVGRNLRAGKAWAKPVAAFIDFFFGKGHCLAASEP